MPWRKKGGGRRRREGYDPSRGHMETVVNYVTMTTEISRYWYGEILHRMGRFLGREYHDKLKGMEVKTGMKEMIKVLQEKEQENCLKILVDVLVECGFLKNTGWKEKPDPISALLFELRESISVIERLMESVKEGDVNKVEQLLSQYPIPQDMERITRECCLLSLERRDLTLVKFLYQEYRSILYNEGTLKRFLTRAVGVDFTEGVQFLFSQGLTPKENINYYMELLEKSMSVDMVRLLLCEEKTRRRMKQHILWKSMPIYSISVFGHDEPRIPESLFYHQILNSSTQPDCMSRVQILVDADVRVENLINKDYKQAWLKIIKERWFQVFDYLLNQLGDINYINENKQNILHVILVTDKDGDVRNNILDFVRNLVERGIDIHSVDKNGQSPLMLSCRAGYYEVVKYLIERGADVNKVDEYGRTALMLAFWSGNNDIVEYLIQHCGADVNKVDKYGTTALMWACEGGNKDTVEYLIEHGGAGVNKVDNMGQTALMLACKEGHKDIVEYLIQDCGADVNMVEYEGEMVDDEEDKLALSTALTITCEKGRKDIVKCLIHGGADVNMGVRFGMTPLTLACFYGYKDIVEYLIEHCGADVNKVDNNGKATLMWACEGGNKDIVEYLIEHCGADVHKVDTNGKTVLMWACEGGHKDVVKYLIQHGGADVNKVDNKGQTTLMVACSKGYKDIVEYVIQHGGTGVNMVDIEGQTALDACPDEESFNTGKKHNALFKFLVESGADLSLPFNGVRLFEKILYRESKELFLFVISLKPQIVDATDKGDNILHILAKVSYEFTVGQFDWLFDGHVDINHENRHTDTPLMVAAVLLNEKYLEVFTHHPAVDLNKQNKHGHTALHCLILGFTELIQGFRRRYYRRICRDHCKQVYPMYMRCVDSLFGAGTDVNVQDNEGKTVLMMAVRENDKQLVRKLLDAGAMVDKVDGSGRHALHYADFSDSVYDLTIFFLIFPSGENHLLDLPCINGNTLIQTVLQFPPKWEPCKVVAFVRWMVSRNCSLRHLRGRTGYSSYNDLSLDDFSCSQRQNLRELLYRSGATKEEIISTVNFQAEDEAENEINRSRNREMFEQCCLNVSLRSMCVRVFRQLLRTEIRSRLPGLEIPHLNNFLLLEDVVGDVDGRVLRLFDELEDESDSCSYIVDKDREYFHYLEEGTRDKDSFVDLVSADRGRRRAYSYYELYD